MGGIDVGSGKSNKTIKDVGTLTSGYNPIPPEVMKIKQKNNDDLTDNRFKYDLCGLDLGKKCLLTSYKLQKHITKEQQQESRDKDTNVDKLFS